MIFRYRLVWPAALLLAQCAFAAEDVKPEAILDKYVEVTGGKAAYEKVKSEVASGTLEITNFGISGALTSYRAAPNKSYTLVDFPGGIGKAEEGSDGTVAWAINAQQGPRIKEGDERAGALRRDALDAAYDWRKYYKKAELAGTEDVGGKPCYKIVLTPTDGGAETRYYDKTSNLLLKVMMPVETPDGKVDVEMALSDYRDEGGILVAHTSSAKYPGAEMMVKIDKIVRNQDIPADRFALPPEIKALADKKPSK